MYVFPLRGLWFHSFTQSLVFCKIQTNKAHPCAIINLINSVMFVVFTGLKTSQLKSIPSVWQKKKCPHSCRRTKQWVILALYLSSCKVIMNKDELSEFDLNISESLLYPLIETHEFCYFKNCRVRRNYITMSAIQI